MVDGLIATSAREAWEALEPAEQVREVLAMADGFDERAIHLLDGIDTDAGEEAAREPFEEARRLRRNADMLRDGIADAYAADVVTDEALLEALSGHGFETATVAEREEQLERVAGAYGFEFRPYGGTLLSEG